MGRGNGQDAGLRALPCGTGHTYNPSAIAANIASSIVGTLAMSLLSVGGYYDTHATKVPTITGTTHLPKATVAWGVATALTIPLLQLTLRNPIRLLQGILTVTMILLAAGTAVTATVAAGETGSTRDHITDNMEDAMANYGNDHHSDSQIDNIQTAYECCGVHDHHVYARAQATLHGAVPPSCCHATARQCPEPPIDLGQTRGCGKIFGTAMETARRNIAITLAVSAAIMTGMAITTFMTWKATATSGVGI